MKSEKMKSKKMMRLVAASLMAIVISASQGIMTEAAGSNQLKTSTIYFNDQAITTTVIEQNGYQLVPASLFRKIGVSVEWNASDKIPVLSRGSYQVKLTIGNRTAYYTSSDSNGWTKDSNLNTRTTLINSSSYVPLAYTAQKLGIQVEYDAKLKAARVLESLSNESASSSSSSSHQLSAEDLHWLYQLTEAEAGGESYQGRVAVAATVLNRVEADDWPNTVTDTVFQVVEVNGKSYYQFEPVLNQYIYEAKPSEETKKAVQAAINGEDPTNGAVVFYNPTKTSNKWILSRPVITTIGNHVFAY